MFIFYFVVYNIFFTLKPIITYYQINYFNLIQLKHKFIVLNDLIKFISNNLLYTKLLKNSF